MEPPPEIGSVLIIIFIIQFCFNSDPLIQHH